MKIGKIKIDFYVVFVSLLVYVRTVFTIHVQSICMWPTLGQLGEGAPFSLPSYVIELIGIPPAASQVLYLIKDTHTVQIMRGLFCSYNNSFIQTKKV